MKKKILISLSYLLVAMLATVATLAAIGYPGYASGTKLEQLESLILERFIGDADQTAMEDAAAAAMVKSLGDRWSYYIPASEYDAHEEQVNNAYVGIGITIEAKEQEGFLVKAVNEGGPAGEAGVQVDDLLVEVEGQDVREMTATDVRNLVRGEEGTCVSLTVLRHGERVALSVERRQVQTVVASGRMLTDKIGLVTIENFDSRCAEETIAAIDDLLGQGAEKLIFDVRNNPGGYAKELVKVLDYLLPEGELFRTVDYAGKENVDYSDADCLDIPMAVLVVASFNTGKNITHFDGFTLKQYVRLFEDDSLLELLRNSLIVSVLASFVATAFGTVAAVGINGLNPKMRKLAMNLTNIPMTNPDIVTGVSLSLLFVFVGTRMLGQRNSLTFWTLLVAHITFNLPYVILNVMPKLKQMDESLVNAAMDLGCTRTQAFFKVTIHEIMPGIISGAIMAFTMSLDDFVISYFVTGMDFITLPVEIYTYTKKPIQPKIYAMFTLLFLLIFVLMVVSNVIQLMGDKKKMDAHGK